MNKKEKANFLKRLSKGEADIKEILPLSLLINIGMEGTTFHVNGEQVQADEYKKYIDLAGKEIKFKVDIV